MRKLLLFIIALMMLSGARIFAQQWSKVGYMIVNGNDTVSGSHVIKGFGANLFCGTLKGLFKSSDNGATWSNLTYTQPVVLNQDIYSVLVASNGNIFAGSKNRLFRSTDGGASWTWLGPLPDTTYYYDIAEIGGNIVVSYVKNTSTYGVYYSSNFGTSWTAATGITSPVRNFYIDGTTLFLGGLDKGVYKSTNNGQTWSVAGTGFPLSPGIWGVLRSANRLFANSATGSGLYESMDNGATWTSSSPTVFNGFCQVFSFSESNGTIILSNDGGSLCNPGGLSSVRLSVNAGVNWVNFLTGTTPPTFFPVVGKNSSGSAFFIKRGSGKEVYRYDQPVGIQALNNVESIISVSPNPTNGKIQITINNLSLVDTELEIFDVVGKKVYGMPVSQQTNEIDLSSLHKGIYFVKIKSSEKTIAKKIILQ